MTNDVLVWEKRQGRLLDLSQLPCIVQAHRGALEAASKLPQNDENAAATLASHVWSSRLIDFGVQGEHLGRSLDISLAVYWSARKGSDNGTNQLRKNAWPSLEDIHRSSLSDSNRDFLPLTCLESNAEGTVELVRCRFNKQIYVLKSTTKGSAKRGHRSNAPMTERRLLSLARNAAKGTSCFTPSFVASFQSSASLHVLMEYCPAGDLYHFLESAGQASASNEARNPSGGLLAERYVRAYAVDIVAAISWLHQQGFMHRDIKPGNWLFDRSGHLLLCDLASSAPFVTFEEVPASASLPKRTSEARSSLSRQRRILFRHCCLIGTPDYIAPEILWAADLMSRRKQRLYESLSKSSTFAGSQERTMEEGEDDDEPPPEGPGLYGPECDWWSVGVVLYEMVYKRLPFFSEKIPETMEMIKHHQQHFHQDYRIECSDELRDLLSCLVTDADRRLGHLSSDEVQSHPYFRGVDWNRPWRLPPPFIPQLQDSIHAQDMSLAQPELSVLHSPRPDVGSDGANTTTFNSSSGAFSKIWKGRVEDFPAFPNSVEYSRIENQDPMSDQPIEIVPGGQEERSLPSVRFSCDESVAAEDHLRSQWSGFDPTWIGFSYVPDKTSFSAPAQGQAEDERAGLNPQTSSPIVLLSSSTADEASTSGIALERPMASTPPHATKSDPAALDTLRSVTKPQSNLHRHAVQTATRLRASSAAGLPFDRRFVTPMRKPSYNAGSSSGVAMTGTSAAVPQSPYPFPVATTAKRPAKTPMTGLALRRKDLDRARSASASAGEGSDSRYSGGSNAKREISEREAWQELQIAVMQTAQKGKWGEQPDHVQRRGDETDYGDDSYVPMHARQGFRRSVSDSHATARMRPEDNPVMAKETFSRRPRLARLMSDDMARKPLEPILDTTPPHRSTISPASSVSPESMQASPTSTRTAGTLSEQSMDTPSDAGLERRMALGRQKSARQLLLKAQHRDTPTRIARSASPMLMEATTGTAKAINVTATLTSNHRANARAESRRTASLDEARRSLDSAVAIDVEGSSGAPLPSAVTNLKKMNTRLMKRRDSHETLSQYRKGIIPEDEPSAQMETPREIVNTTPMSEPRTSLQAAARSARPISLTITAPSTATATLKGERPLSSPRLPLDPDTFSASQEESILRVTARPSSRLRHRQSTDANQQAGPSGALDTPSLVSADAPTSVARRRSAIPLQNRDINATEQNQIPKGNRRQNTRSDMSNAKRNVSANAEGDGKTHDAEARSRSRRNPPNNVGRPSLVRRASDFLTGRTDAANGDRRTNTRDAQAEPRRAVDREDCQPRRTSTAQSVSRAASEDSDDDCMIALDQSAGFNDLAWRYNRLRANILQIEGNIERLKLRMNSDG